MIKMIAFDLIGVLCKKNEETDRYIIDKVKQVCGNVKIVIATNNYSLIRNFIEDTFNTENLDDIFISAEMNTSKPDTSFYEYILNKYNLKPHELLFIDDSQMNVDSAKRLGINTIKINDGDDVYEKVVKFLGK